MAEVPETLAAPEHVRDPFPALAALRASEPVFWDPGLEGWLVTRHRDVKAMLVDARVTPDRRAGRNYVPPPTGSWAYRIDNEAVQAMSAEEHKRWRMRMAKGFTPRAVRRMEAQVRDVVNQFARPLVGRRGVVDLVGTFTNPIPNTVIGRIAGIPPYPGDEDRFRALAQDTLRRFFHQADAENIRLSELATEELAEWVGKLAEERRQEPAEDLLSDLIHGNAESGYRMSNDEIVMIVAMLVAAGSETTTIGGTESLRLLLEHPDQLALLRERPERVEGAVREILRFGMGTVGGVLRFALEDFEFEGQTIRRGDTVLVAISSANRDESAFPDPDRFDITRDTQASLIFGSGPHYCLGANLALQELGCMLDAALEFLPEGARLLGDRIQRMTIGTTRRIVELPVDFG